jgi:exopolysaccharide biosynthesis protein
MTNIFKKISAMLLSWRALSLLLFISLGVLGFFYYQNNVILNNKISKLKYTEKDLQVILKDTGKQLLNLKNEDQYKKNKQLETTIKNIEDTYKKSVSLYEKILDFQGSTKKNANAELLAKSLHYLSERNYASASSTLISLDKQIVDEQSKITATFSIPANVISQNSPPASGYSRQKVSTDVGDFLIDIVSADLNTTKVVVDTGSDSDCKDNCPVLSLGDYASRSGAFAGINGSYFCPADYPSCAGKVNSFDTLAMNKNKKYLNSENNVYSVIPAVIFSGNSARYVGASQEWGRDTNVDSVLANYPLLLTSGNIACAGSSESKHNSKGSRSFIGTKDSNVYIGVVYNATVVEVAQVLKKMGLQNALNLDSGGSTALWSGGYKVGPGRNLPNALLFVHK